MGLTGLIVSLTLQALAQQMSRWAILSTSNDMGLNHISQLALQNCKDLLPILHWNHERNICLFRYLQA